ncbi:MAG: HAD-IA family hydrolase [Roseburia sp.]|nr:HAD-IA family hydrolase [Roseburia sp.]
MAEIRPRKKLALIGAMGSGKSSLARRYTQKYGGSIFDTDAEFVKRYGAIEDFFARRGEAEFRKIECDILAEAASSDAAVVATGGGAVLSKGGMYALRKSCDIAYLTAPLDVLESRIKKSARPLKNDIARIVAERGPLYRKYADYTVDSSVDSLSSLELLLDKPRANRYDVVLCDADDTILDFAETMKNSIIAAARRENLSVPDDKVYSVYKTLLPKVWERLERGEITRERLETERFAELGKALGEDIDVVHMNETYTEEMMKRRDVRDGAVEFLKALRARGIRVYIVSNGIAKIKAEQLKAISDCVDGAFVSETVGYNKPDVRFFERVEADIGGIDKARTMVFGDSVTSDIEGGIRFGVDTCLYDPSGLKRSAADYTVASYAQFLDIV